MKSLVLVLVLDKKVLFTSLLSSLLSAMLTAEERLIVIGSLCVCLCLIISCEQSVSKSYKQILMKFCGEMGCGRRRNQVDFGSNPVSFLDPGSFSRVFSPL